MASRPHARRNAPASTTKLRQEELGDKKSGGNRKGCSLGYALASGSYEEATSVETCTATAPDAITAFAVPCPNGLSQGRRFFRAWLLFELPRRADHPVYFGLTKFYLSQSFRPSTNGTVAWRQNRVNARFWCKSALLVRNHSERTSGCKRPPHFDVTRLLVQLPGFSCRLCAQAAGCARCIGRPQAYVGWRVGL